MNILFIGDIVGRTGRNTVVKILKDISEEDKIDLIIANGENLSGGLGITKDSYDQMIKAGIEIITTGNHVFDKPDIVSYLEDKKIKILRPINYPSGVPGKGLTEIEIFGTKIVVVSLMGRVFINLSLNDPFLAMDEIIKDNPNKLIVVDFHAEATSEKYALFKYLDGKVAAILGTHTHIPTADAQVSAKGTAFICDTGMVGAYDSILGFETEPLIKRFITQTPQRFEVAKGPSIFSAVVLETNGLKIKNIKQLIKIIE